MHPAEAAAGGRVSPVDRGELDPSSQLPDLRNWAGAFEIRPISDERPAAPGCEVFGRGGCCSSLMGAVLNRHRHHVTHHGDDASRLSSHRNTGFQLYVVGRSCVLASVGRPVLPNLPGASSLAPQCGSVRAGRSRSPSVMPPCRAAHRRCLPQTAAAGTGLRPFTRRPLEDCETDDRRPRAWCSAVRDGPAHTCEPYIALEALLARAVDHASKRGGRR